MYNFEKKNLFIEEVLTKSFWIAGFERLSFS